MRIATPEQIKKYWLDRCPICGGKATGACRCYLSIRLCKQKHYWRRLPDGTPIICTPNHTDLEWKK